MAANKYQRDFQDAAAAYGASPAVLSHIARLESGYRPNVQNNWDSNAKAGIPSAGLMQFIEPTFNAYARQAREANPAAWQGTPMEWKNPRAQILATAWAIANGKGSAWATFERAKKAAGAKGSLPVSRGATAAPVASQQVSSTDPMSDPETAALEFIFKGSAWEGEAAKRYRPTRPSATPATANPASMQQAEGKGFFVRKKGETGQQYLDRLLEAKFGLKHDAGNAQTTGGKHRAGSTHYQGLGTDYGDAKNSPKVLKEARNWVDANRTNFVGGISELLYGRDDDPSGGHDDHLHVATQRSTKGLRKR